MWHPSRRWATSATGLAASTALLWEGKPTRVQSGKIASDLLTWERPQSVGAHSWWKSSIQRGLFYGIEPSKATETVQVSRPIMVYPDIDGIGRKEDGQ
jgi:hypothetical protein